MSSEASALGGVLVGAGTLLGQEVRRLLASRALPLRDVAMMADGDEVGQVLELGGEARLVTGLGEDLLAQADLVILAERSAAARRALAAAGRAAVVDLVDAAAGGPMPVVNMAVNARDLPPCRPARIRAPHPAAQTLSSVLASLAGDASIRRLEATVLTPVSDAGEAGVEELYRQTTGVLNFTDRPTAVFDRQAAFNIIPHALLSRQQGWPDLDARLREELGAIHGLGPGQVGTRALLAPVFHGLCLSVSVELDSLPAAAERRRRLEKAGFATAPMTPAELGESEAVHVADLGEEASRCLALWIVADNLRSGAAANAVAIARAMLEPGRATAPVGARRGGGR